MRVGRTRCALRRSRGSPRRAPSIAEPGKWQVKFRWRCGVPSRSRGDHEVVKRRGPERPQKSVRAIRSRRHGQRLQDRWHTVTWSSTDRQGKDQRHGKMTVTTTLTTADKMTSASRDDHEVLGKWLGPVKVTTSRSSVPRFLGGPVVLRGTEDSRNAEELVRPTPSARPQQLPRRESARSHIARGRSKSCSRRRSKQPQPMALPAEGSRWRS